LTLSPEPSREEQRGQLRLLAAGRGSFEPCPFALPRARALEARLVATNKAAVRRQAATRAAIHVAIENTIQGMSAAS
jgi:hypothetical protein